MILNEGVEREELSWGARGLLWYLLTKPDNWEVRLAALIEASPDGKRKLQGYLGELESLGYVVRWCDRGAGGRLHWRSEIFESLEDAAVWNQENSEISAGLGSTIDTKRIDGENTPKNLKSTTGGASGDCPAYSTADTFCVDGKCTDGENLDKKIDSAPGKGSGDCPADSTADTFTSDGPPYDGGPYDGGPYDGKRAVIINTDQTNTDQTNTDQTNTHSLSSKSEKNSTRESEGKNDFFQAPVSEVGTTANDSSPVLPSRKSQSHSQQSSAGALPSGEGQGSAAAPQNFKIQHGELPPWRLSWEGQDYLPDFVDYTHQRLQIQYGNRSRSDAIGRIYNAERQGRHAQIRADFDDWLSKVANQAHADQQRQERMPLPEDASPYAEALAALARGDCGEALTMIRGYATVLKLKFGDVPAALKAKEILPRDAPDVMGRCTDEELSKILEYLHSQVGSKLARNSS